MHTVYSDIRIIAHSSTIKMPLSEMQKTVARESFLHHGPKKHECKKCRKIVTSDSVERWASHLRSCANVCSETKSLLPTAKDSCRPSVIVIDGSTQPNGCLPGPSSSWKNQPSCLYIGTPEVLELEREPKRRARARSEVEVSGKLTAFIDHMDSASQQRHLLHFSSRQRSHFI